MWEVEWRNPAPRREVDRYSFTRTGDLIPAVPLVEVDEFVDSDDFPHHPQFRFSVGDVVMVGGESDTLSYDIIRPGSIVRIDVRDEMGHEYRVVLLSNPERSRWFAEGDVVPLPEGVEIPTRSGVMEFKSSYMSRAHTPKVVSKVFRRMWQHNDVVPEFDTIVGTGLSGSLVLPSLARALTRHFGRKISYLLVRKDNDGSHSFRELEGSIGTRWLFVDDLVESGNTLRRCIEKVASCVPDAELVGVFLYGTGDSRAGVGNGRLYPCSQVNDDGRWTYKGHKYSNESIDEFGTFHASF